MRNVTLKGLLAHKLRLALTALAIVLGVTFICGTFVLTDTLQSTFNALFGTIYSKVDFQVRGAAQLGSGANATRRPIPESLLAAVRRVPGVGAADGQVQGYAQFVARDGQAISTGGAPTLGVSFDPYPQLSALHMVAGGPPKSPDDVAMDAGTAQKYGFAVGQRVRVLTVGAPRTFTITGIVQFGTASNLAGATLAAFTLPVAQALSLLPGQLNDINVVTAPGASKAAVQRAIARVLPPGTEVVTGQTVAQENTSSIDQSLSFFSTALLVFAFISLFVGAFTIYNTFSIIVGQRTRELALLRIVGASRRQVFSSVLIEAGITGFASSVVGLGLGVLAAIGLEALLRGFGISLPPESLVFAPRTVLVGLVTGTVVTVASAIGPARAAVRIPPVVALDDRQPIGAVSLRRRLIGGGALALAGVVLLAIGLAQSAIGLVGVGAAGLFLGVAMLSPAIARPLASVIGRPLARTLGVAGKLGRENSMRSPRRTAQTAAALMIGLALVSAMATFGASVSRSATASADQAISADLIVTASGSGRLSDAAASAASKVPGVTTATSFYSGRFEAGDALTTLTAVSTAHLADTVILRMTAGTAGALARGELLIDSTTATSGHLSVGDTIRAQFTRTGRTTLRVGGIYQANALIGSYVVSAAFFAQHYSAGRAAAAHHRHQRRPRCGQSPDPLPEPPGPDQGPVRAGPGGQRQPAARAGVRPARPGGAHRAHRDREHAHAVGVRAHPRDRPAPRGRHAPPPGPHDGQVRGGDPGHLRRHRRDRDRHRAGPRPGRLAAVAGHHRDRRAGVQPADLPAAVRRARPDRRHLARPPRRPPRHPGRHSHRIAPRSPRSPQRSPRFAPARTP
jgi:putative ABC transport system permease protein